MKWSIVWYEYLRINVILQQWISFGLCLEVNNRANIEYKTDNIEIHGKCEKVRYVLGLLGKIEYTV